mmetsp:Transcript_22650/g.65201  ORF Transcript_22650/g.65201 Transcript_22650/m.65201 type:complete len:1025 (+) Transcript_22650:63-3137(+)
MAEDTLLSHRQQQEDGNLWDELSHQQSREQLQWQRHQSASHGGVAGTSAAALRTAAQLSGAAISAAGSAAAAAALGARQGYHRLRTQGSVTANRSPVSDTTGLAEFGLDSASHPIDGLAGYAVGPGVLVDGGQGDAGVSLLANEYEQGGMPKRSNSMGIRAVIPPIGGGGDASHADDTSGIGFVFLRNFRLRPSDDGWGAVANLDLFFNSIYNYYYQGGLSPIIGSGIVELVSLFFTLWLSVFLFAYLDWNKLVSCTDETSCDPDLHSYFIDKPFATASLWNFLVVLYCLLFLCYGAFATMGFFGSMRDAFRAKHFYENRLGISARKLEGGAVEWNEIVSRISALQASGEHRIAIHGQEINALTIAQRIMRKENFMVAFFNIGALDLSVPIPMARFANKRFFSKSLEWSIYFTVLSYMYNHKYQIRPSFYMDPSSLKRRLILCGLAHTVFMPFLLFFMTLHFSMLNLYDWRSTKQYLGPREWSPVAKWTFREFNELPHAFDRRLGPSYQASEDYLKLFTQSAAVTSLGRGLVFVSGSLGAVLLALAAVNDSILLHVKLGQWNLLWYVGILGVAYSIGKALLPDAKAQRPSTRNLFAEMDTALENVSTHTHYFPDVWQKRGWDSKIYSAFSSLFQYKAKLFATEILSVMLAPLVLCVSLPKCAEHICAVVQKVKTDIPGVGDVCGFSTFDFDAFEDESWGRPPEDASVGDAASQSSTTQPARKRSPEVQMRLDSRPKTRMGKMEKSFFSFKANHPSWKCSSQSGQDLVDQVETYQNQVAHALARERQAHIEAAARQIETLRQLEQMHQGHDVNNPHQQPTGPERLQESYIGPSPPHAGAGAAFTGISVPQNADSGADSGGGGSAPLHSESQREVPNEAARCTTPSSSMHDTVGELPPTPAQHMGPRFGNTSLQHSGLGSIRTVPSTSSLFPSGTLGSGPAQSVMTGTASTSVLHYADNALSTELARVLNRSTLDPTLSVLDSDSFPSLGASMMNSSTLADNTEGDNDRSVQMYRALNRYHSARNS